MTELDYKDNAERGVKRGEKGNGENPVEVIPEFVHMS